MPDGQGRELQVCLDSADNYAGLDRFGEDLRQYRIDGALGALDVIRLPPIREGEE